MADDSSPKSAALSKPLTVERLRALLHYDPEAGKFTRRQSAGGQQSGVPVGFVTHGYLKIQVGGRKYYAHRLAWFYMTGRWPAKLIDHRNRQTADNRFSNLREASNTQNLWNRGPTRANKLGLKGVTLTTRPGRMWRATIKSDGKQRHVGYFRTKEEAASAYAAAANALHGEFATVQCFSPPDTGG